MKWVHLFNHAQALVAVVRAIAFLIGYAEFSIAAQDLQFSLVIASLSFYLRHSINERRTVNQALRGNEAAMKKYLEEKK